MTEAVRARAPWVVWAIGILLLGATLTLVALNGSNEDPFFIPLAVAMITGYSTVGAVVASRDPRNLLGWLMIAIGAAFVFTGFASEYVLYTFETNPGALPLGGIAALLSESLWMPMIAALCVLALLFPTGRVPTARWRFLPPTMVGLVAVFLVGMALRPGPFDEIGVNVRIDNPLGVDGLGLAAEIASGISSLALLLCAPLTITALVLRYRRSRGEERQQIRWLAYIAVTTVVVIVSGIAASLLVGESRAPFVGEIFFTITFALIGIGVPGAMGIAILRYRLYDLDVVVKKTVLYGTVAALLTAVFVIVAVVVGWVAGGSQAGAVVAAAVIGLAFWPALRLARRLADRIVYGRRATPYEVLADFSARVGGSYGAEDVLPRMARILRDGVGAAKAVVWLRVGAELRPAGVIPMGDAPLPRRLSADELPALGADAAVEVRDGGELLGALAVSMPPNDPMTPSRERLVRDLAAQAGLVLRNVGLIEELRESRLRIVAAQDERAKKLERNIHDGAQQQLVALAVKLRLAEQLSAKDPDRTRSMLAELRDEANDALENLRDLARGIYPPLLADKGLADALEAQARKSPVPVTVDADGVGRYAQEAEAAVYFCVLEALQNAAKYAGANEVRVTLAEANGDLTFTVRDNGVGFDPRTARGSGLANMRDRLEALRGGVEVRSTPGAGTTVEGRVSVTPRKRLG